MGLAEETALRESHQSHRRKQDWPPAYNREFEKCGRVIEVVPPVSDSSFPIPKMTGDTLFCMAADTHVAEQFGNALAKGDFVLAHELLTEEAQRTHSPAALEQAIKDMTSYAEGPIEEVEVMDTLDAWPDKLQGDVAWVYVSLAGDSFAEAVTLILTNTPKGTRIRCLEWGRP